MALHKSLVDLEKESYERIHGRVSPVDFLNLLLQNPDYAWLRKISELIVWLDEILDPKEMTAEIETKNVLEQARKLLTPSELGEDFERKYHDALQRNPDVILAHQQVRNILMSSE
jgi:hypothetical protein